MKAVVMAGGKGTRLRPLTNKMPKPMMPIVDTPILEHIVNHLKKHGITEIAMTLNYLPYSIIDYFGNGERFGVEISYFIETEPLGTAGSVRATFDFVGEDFIVISGDAFTNVDLTKMMDFHYKKQGLVTLAVKEIENPVGFGIVEKGEDGKIESFLEKPTFAIDKAFVNTGIYVMNKKVLHSIPQGFYDFSKQVFPEIIEEMYAYPTQDYWSDIGTLESYYLANRDAVLYPERFSLSI